MNATAEALEDFAHFIVRPKYQGFLDQYTLEEVAREALARASAIRESA